MSAFLGALRHNRIGGRLFARRCAGVADAGAGVAQHHVLGRSAQHRVGGGLAQLRAIQEQSNGRGLGAAITHLDAVLSRLQARPVRALAKGDAVVHRHPSVAFLRHGHGHGLGALRHRRRGGGRSRGREDADEFSSGQHWHSPMVREANVAASGGGRTVARRLSRASRRPGRSKLSSKLCLNNRRFNNGICQWRRKLNQSSPCDFDCRFGVD